MPLAATSRSLRLASPQASPLVAVWSRFVAFLVLMHDVMHDARALERAAHQRTPFIDW